MRKILSWLLVVLLVFASVSSVSALSVDGTLTINVVNIGNCTLNVWQKYYYGHTDTWYWGATTAIAAGSNYVYSQYYDLSAGQSVLWRLEKMEDGTVIRDWGDSIVGNIGTVGVCGGTTLSTCTTVTNQFTLRNNDVVSHFFAIHNGSSYRGSVSIGAGRTYTDSITTSSCDPEVQLTFVCIDCVGSSGIGTPGDGSPERTISANGGTTDIYQPGQANLPPSLSWTNSSPVGGGIGFSTNAAWGTGGATEATLKQVGDAIYDVNAKGFNKLDTGLSSLGLAQATDFDVLTAAVNAKGDTLSTAVATGSDTVATHVDSLTDMMEAANTTAHADAMGISNVLSMGVFGTNAVSVSVTNFPDMSWTNMLADDLATDTEAAGWITNYNDALAASAGPLDSAETSFSLLGGLTAPEIAAGSGAGLLFSFTAGANQYEVNLDPMTSALWSDLFDLSFTFTTWLIALLFAGRVAQDSWSMVLTMNTMHGIKPLIAGHSKVSANVPKKSVGGWLGFITKLLDAGGAVLLAIPVGMAVLAAWAAFLALFFSLLGDLLLEQVLQANPLEGAPAIALYLANAAFPLQLLFGMSVGYLVFKFSLAGAMIACSRAVKFIVGA